jgi:phenylacetic acid degradation operon negative regulatory protein
VGPSPKSLVLDLLSTARRGPIAVRALVAAGDLFGIAENAIRVALARLRACGLVERDERGRYRLAPGAAAVQAQVSSWRRTEQRVRPWRGGWLAVHTAALSPRVRRSRPTARALDYLGFRELTPGLVVRPDNLAGGAPVVRAQLRALGLPAQAPVFALSELDADDERRARGLWDARTLVRTYRGLRAALDASARRLPTLSVGNARVESFRLGGRAIRQLVLDPLLPEPLLPAGERRALLEALLRYDRLGRACWAGALEHAEVAPVDLRLLARREPAPREEAHDG